MIAFKKILNVILVFALLSTNFQYLFGGFISLNDGNVFDLVDSAEILNLDTSTKIIEVSESEGYSSEINLYAEGNGVTLQSYEDMEVGNDDLEEREMTIAKYVPGEIVVKFKTDKINIESQGIKNLSNTLSKHPLTLQIDEVSVFANDEGLVKTDELLSNNTVLFEIAEDQNFDEKLKELNDNPNVEYAEPNYIYELMSTNFNDTYSGNLRGLQKINWYNAHDIFDGNVVNKGTIVAVIDAGVAWDHPDLVANMRDGDNCKDEYGNYLGGCIHGYDFEDNDKNPYPVRSFHGTHVAGTIGAVANNGQGIIGVNPHTQIMALRGGDTSLTELALAKSIDFALQNGAKIINASFGGSYSSVIYDAINRFRSEGGLFIAAAGNGGNDGVGDNNDGGTHIYPCDLPLDNIICVAATTQTDGLASFSNYGKTSVDVGAPGVGIKSTTIDIFDTSNIYTHSFDSSFGDFTTGGNDCSRGISGGMAMGGLRGFTNTYLKGINDSYIQKTINLTGYLGYNMLITSYCNTPQNSHAKIGDSLKGTYLSGSNEQPFLRINSSENAYTHEDSLIKILGIPTVTNGNFKIQSILSNVDAFKNKPLTIRLRWQSDNTVDQTNHVGCKVKNVLFSRITHGDLGYVDLNGTSMATPHVAGLASLAWSMRPDLNYAEIKSAIMDNGDSFSALSGKTVSGKRINAYKTLIALSEGQGPNRTSIYTNISNSLISTGIVNNLSTVNNTNVEMFTGLYFAKMSGNKELGRITFPTGLNLTDTGIQTFLAQNLKNAIGMKQGQIWFNPGTGFVGKNAKLKMNIPELFSGILGSMNANSFSVRDGNGGILIGNSFITNVYSGGNCGAGEFGCSIYLDVDHFTQFDIRPFLPQVHIESNYIDPTNSVPGNTVILTFTGSENLSGVTVKINGQNIVPSGSGISRIATFNVTGGTVSGPVTFEINYYDVDNNSGTIVNATTDGSLTMVTNDFLLAPIITTTTQTLSGNNIDIVGTSDANNIIKIQHGSIILATGMSDGNFNINVPLIEGDNVIQAYAVNANNVYSSGSNIVIITRDSTKPDSPIIITPTQEVATGIIFLKGTAEYLSTVYIYSGENEISSGNSNGIFSIAVPLNEGTNKFISKAVDIAGNISNESSSVTINRDSSKGTVPGAIPAPYISTEDQTVTGTNINIKGSATANTNIEIERMSTIFGGMSNVAGLFNINVTLNEGLNVLSAYAISSTFVRSDPDLVLIIRDSTAPVAPSISTLNQTVNSLTITLTGTAENLSKVYIYSGNTVVASGNSNGNFAIYVPLVEGNNTFIAKAVDIAGNPSTDSNTVTITRDSIAPDAPIIITSNQTINGSTINLTGIAENLSKVSIYRGGTIVASGNSNGNFSITVPLNEGSNIFTAKAVDTVGNVSIASNAVTITNDSIAPNAPIINTLNQTVNNSTITLTGTAENLSKVSIYSGSTVVGSGTSNGNFSINVLLNEGSNIFTAKAVDTVGNVSIASNAVTITRDSIAPNAPIISTPNQTVNSSTITLTGIAENLSKVSIYRGGTIVASGNSNGNFSITVLLNEGSNIFTAKAVDSVGNISSSSNQVIITKYSDGPNPPTIITTSQLLSGSNINITGTAELNTIVTITRGNIQLATGMSDGSFDINVPLIEGANELKAYATNSMGNTSNSSNIVTITRDSIAPNPPIIGTPNQTVNSSTIILTGTAENLSNVSIYRGSTVVGSGTSNGNFSITIPLNEGAYIFTAKAVDSAGNTSNSSNIVTITSDLIPPNAPIISTPNQTVNSSMIILTGIAENLSKVSIYRGSTVVSSGTSNGNFSITVPLNEGNNVFTAKALDSVGNISSSSNQVTIIRNLISSNVPVISNSNQITNATGIIITGTVSSGSMVYIYKGGYHVGDGLSDGTFSVGIILNEGINSITAYARDIFGNDSLVSNTVIITQDVVAPSISITSPINLQVTGEVINLKGTVIDLHLSSVIINGEDYGNISSFDLSMQLVGGLNNIYITGIDAAGNITAASIDIVRKTYVSNIQTTHLSETTERINFITDLSSLTFIKYGTGEGFLSNIITGTIAENHTIDIYGLTSDTTYYYVIGAINNGYYSWSSTGSFNTIDTGINVHNVHGNVVVTGAIHLGGSTTTGAVFTSTGVLKLIGRTPNYFLQIPTSGFIIYSNVWNSLLFPPTYVDIGSVEAANFGEPGIPAQTSGSITRDILGTIRVGANSDELVSSGLYFTVSFVSPWGLSGKVVKLYRSNDGNNWTGNTPDATCTLDSNLVCAFRTDHLRYFAAIKERPSLSTGTTTCISTDLVCIDNRYEKRIGANCQGGMLGNICTGDIDGPIHIGNITNSPYNAELNSAYMHAYRFGVTTMPTIQQADMNGNLIRSHMAKMMVNYAINVLGKTPDTSKRCVFPDMENQSNEIKGYAIKSCQLGLMGIGITNFEPYGIVTRAQFGTVLSRMLYNTAETGSPYYLVHLNLLKEKGIINNNNPALNELRGYVMIMLMRAANHNK